MFTKKIIDWSSFLSSATILRRITDFGCTGEEKVSGHFAQYHRDQKPNVECHHDQHQHVGDEDLTAIQ